MTNVRVQLMLHYRKPIHVKCLICIVNDVFSITSDTHSSNTALCSSWKVTNKVFQTTWLQMPWLRPRVICESNQVVWFILIGGNSCEQSKVVYLFFKSVYVAIFRETVLNIINLWCRVFHVDSYKIASYHADVLSNMSDWLARLHLSIT